MKLETLLRMVDEVEDELVALEQELVRIPTVNTGEMPTGYEREACEVLQKKFSREGLPAETLEAAPERGNFIGRLEGGGGGPGLLFMSHLDVVPPGDESAWAFPPFSGELRDGKVLGRGSTDCKAIATSQAMAAILLKRAGVRLRGSIICLAAADEETGGRFGVGWLAAEHTEKIRAEMAINEGSGQPFRLGERVAYHLSYGEKGRFRAKFRLSGKSCHPARPWLGVNPILALGELLQRILSYVPDLDVSADIFPALKGLLPELPEIEPGNIDKIISELSEGEPLLSDLLRGMSRLTISPTVVAGGRQTNVIPDECCLTCDIRTLPRQDEAYVRGILEGFMEGMPGLTLDLEHTAISNNSPTGTPFAAALKAATSRVLPEYDLTWVPALNMGYTDSRFLRPLGTVVYNFGPDHPEVDPSIPKAHQRNEAVEVRGLLLRTKIYLTLACMSLNAEVEL